MKKHYIYIVMVSMVCLLTGVGVVMAIQKKEEASLSLQMSNVGREIARLASQQDSASQKKKKVVKKSAVPRKKTDYTISGTLRDTSGEGLADVTVSDGYTCVKTDAKGHYRFTRDSLARFVYYTVPDYCEVPVHSEECRTACFYQSIEEGKKTYDFTLTRLPEGKEKAYRMIVLGDPQVTTTMNPFYTSPDDNPIKMSDLERFTSETMEDIRRTIRRIPEGIPVYGLSMGDDVQYYGGYDATLEHQIRAALGSTSMRLFSVIGNHDQDGKALYKRKWEESFGPTDYSFDRGDEHYVCINNCFFTKKAAYYSPGELHQTQMEWLKQDLALTPKDKKVILCYHIPFTFGTSPYSKAHALGMESEQGHYASSRLASLLELLEQFKGGYELFCGHTHFAINHEINFEGREVMEHCHAAACGNIWQSNINICGTPNGYYVYSFDGTRLTDCYYKGTRWEESKQMTLFRAETDFNGESYSEDWTLPKEKNVLVANVFNADSRWKIYAVEDDKEYPMHRINSKGQDAFAAGYHHKYIKAMPFRFVSKQNGYLIMNHLYWYEPKNPDALITVKAIDPYGHTYTEVSTEVIKEPFNNFAHYYKNM